MKKSFEMSRAFHRSWARPTTESASALGVRPFSAAAFSIFWPCSSVPVRKKTSWPASLWKRARASAMTVV